MNRLVKMIVSALLAEFAFRTAWRSEPSPLSLALVTLNSYSKAPMSVLPNRLKPR